MHEDIDLSNRHMTRWKRAWWIGIHDGSTMRSAGSGEQPEERLKKPAMVTWSDRPERQPKRQNGKSEERMRERNRRHSEVRTLYTSSYPCLQPQLQHQQGLQRCDYNDHLCVASDMTGEAQRQSMGRPVAKASKVYPFRPEAPTRLCPSLTFRDWRFTAQ